MSTTTQHEPCTLKDIRLYEKPIEIWHVNDDGEGTEVANKFYDEPSHYECKSYNHGTEYFETWDEAKAHLAEVKQ